MLLFGLASPQIGQHPFSQQMMGLGATSCNVDSDCSGGQTCNAASGMCEDYFSNSSSTSVASSISSGAGLTPPSTASAWNVPTSSPAANSSSTPWYATILSAFGAGAAAGLKPSAAPVLPVATPWYSSPLALGALAIGAVALIMMLKK